MAKVTSKLQVTLPKRIAVKHGIQPGDEIEFQSAGDVIRIVPAGRSAGSQLSPAERLRLFDEATARLEQRAPTPRQIAGGPSSRDWTREELYTRGDSD